MNCELCTEFNFMCIFALYVCACSRRMCLRVHLRASRLHGCGECIYSHRTSPPFRVCVLWASCTQPCKESAIRAHSPLCCGPICSCGSVVPMDVVRVRLGAALSTVLCVTIGPHWFVVLKLSPCLGTLHMPCTFGVTSTLSIRYAVGIDVGVLILFVHIEEEVVPLCLSTGAGLVTSPLGYKFFRKGPPSGGRREKLQALVPQTGGQVGGGGSLGALGCPSLPAFPLQGL